jgi:hypothetical protein
MHYMRRKSSASPKARRTRYEFGVKVSVAATNREGLVLRMLALPGNPYDGHTLVPVLAQARAHQRRGGGTRYVDRGYRGHGLGPRRVFISGQRRGVTRTTIRRELRQRSAIEPVIGHMKTDGPTRSQLPCRQAWRCHQRAAVRRGVQSAADPQVPRNVRACPAWLAHRKSSAISISLTVVLSRILQCRLGKSSIGFQTNQR